MFPLELIVEAVIEFETSKFPIIVAFPVNGKGLLPTPVKLLPSP